MASRRQGPAHDGRVLVVGPAWIGDMVMAQSLYKALRRARPGVQIDVVAPAWSEPLLARMPEVRRAIVLPLGHGELGLGTRWRSGRALREAGYEQAIVLPRSLKAALLPWFARIPRRTGYRGEWRYGLLNDIRPLDKAAMPQMVQRYVALGGAPDAALPRPAVSEDVPAPRLEVDPDNRAQVLARLGLDAGRPVLGLMPGAEYGPAKRWSAERFAELARGLLAEGWAVWVFGSAKEAPLGSRIAAAAPGVANLCGKTRLVDALDLISLARAVVTNDSGLMHVSAALDRPLVALYGSSTPIYTPPLSGRAMIEYLGLECSPCFERTCPRGDYACLVGIHADAVIGSIRKLLEQSEIQ